MNVKTILALSILINLAALGTVGYLLNSKNQSNPIAAQPAGKSATPSLPARKTSSAEKKASVSGTNAPAQTFGWRMVESGDYRQYIANLRSIGCPEETIRDIIVADVNKLFESRKKEMHAASTNKFQFWKSSSMFGNMLDEDKIKQKQALAQEKRELLTALLGSAPEEKADLGAAVNPFQELLDFLPDGKQSKVVDLIQTYQAKAMKALKGGAPDAEDMKEMHKVQKEMEVELGKVLTPDELEGYQLRLSQTAMMMRMQLASFDPNEQEFRDIFKVKKKYEDEQGGDYSDSENTKNKNAKKEMNDQIKGILGENRFADYERAQDYAYQGIAKVAERQGLPKESAIKAYDMKKVAEDEAKKLRADQSLSNEQRTAALKAIRTETERAMTEALGQPGFEAYQKGHNAYWLKQLSPNEKTTKPAQAD
jgi:hypothetical protein